MTGTFKVAEQRGGVGYFGKVDLEVEPDDNIKGCEIIFQEPRTNEECAMPSDLGFSTVIHESQRASFTRRVTELRCVGFKASLLTPTA